MNAMEFNKIFAAVLVAGIVASFSGFLAVHVMHEEKLEVNAYQIEGVEDTGSGTVLSKPSGPEPILPLLSSADVTRGEKLSRACAACHSFTKGGPDGTGPNLWDIVERAKAGKSGFAYSDALQNKGGDWAYSELNHFLWKPKDYLPGTKMNYIGLKKPEDRAAMIAWLRTLSDNPPSLPSDEEILEQIGEEEAKSEEAADEAIEEAAEDITAE